MRAPDNVQLDFVGTVPASPGFYVLGVVSDENGCPSEAIKYPVVAWALEEDTLAPYPVTLEGVQTDNCYILQPDGNVERPCVDGYANIDDWLAAQKECWKRSKRGNDGC